MSKLLIGVIKAIQLQSGITRNICLNKIPSLTVLDNLSTTLTKTSISAGTNNYSTITDASTELSSAPVNKQNQTTINSKVHRKRYKRILTAEEKEENRIWLQTAVSSSDIDSFGDIWQSTKNSTPQPLRNVSKIQKKKRIVGKPKEQLLRNTPKIQNKERIVEKAEVSFKGFHSLGSETNLSSWSDSFGSLADTSEQKKLLYQETEDDSFIDDKRDKNEGRTHIRLSPKGRLHEPYWYAGRIKQLGKEGKILEAIDTLEDTMLKKHRVMPNAYIFNQLLGILGKTGYTKKAFSLFNKMKKMGIQPTGHTYTSLFNCCSNSPWLSDGLQRTHKLHQLILDKEVPLHPITYKAMIKSYSICGDIQTAFKVADSFCEIHPPDTELFSFLLMGCVSDKMAGLRHALQVWKQMSSLKIKPDLPLYNLLIRTIRDSGFGTTSNVMNFPERIAPSTHNKSISSVDKDKINEDCEIPVNSVNHSKADQLVQPISDLIENEPNYFDQPESGKNLDLTYPDNRLALIGGPFSILKDMEKMKIKPNILTFTQLIDCLPLNNNAEVEILDYMKSLGVQPDIDLYNMIIRRRNRSQRYLDARDVLHKIGEDNLHPNQRTFGCLAMGCRKLSEAKELLCNIDEIGMEPNIEIFGLLIHKSNMDFKYKFGLLKMMPKWDLKPNTIFIEHIENHIANARKKILQMEQTNEVGLYFKTTYFKESFKTFMQFYPKWLKSVGFDKPGHPWEDFRHPKETDIQNSES